MKPLKIFLISMMTVGGVVGYAQNLSVANSVQALKIKELTARRDNLQKQIKTEDSKRNQIIRGISLEAQEQMNERQDSICLALRSQLVSVDLELKELVPDETASKIKQQLDKLQNGQQQSPKGED